MKFSKSLMAVFAAGLGLTLVYSQQSGSDAQRRALEVLRQTETRQTPSAPAASASPSQGASTAATREQLMFEVERLRSEGKISAQQYDTFKQNIAQHFAPDAAGSQTESLAQQALAQKIQQLQTSPAAPVTYHPPPVTAATAAVAPAPVAPANTEAQALAQRALEEQLAREKSAQAAKSPAPPPKAAPQPVARQSAPAPAPKPAPAPVATQPQSVTQTRTVVQPAVQDTEAQRILREQMAQQNVRTVERVNVVPVAATTSMTPAQEAEARRALEQALAERNARPAPVVAAPQAPPAAAPVVVQTAPAPTPVVPTAASVPTYAQPMVNTPAQMQAMAAFRERQAGLDSDTPELTKILRLKMAELNGIMTPEEAAGYPVATTLPYPNPWLALTPVKTVPFHTTNTEGLARLKELTAMYKSSSISPGEYHRERARIVATL